jgi:hypothetical protein
MHELILECLIDGRNYSCESLAKVQHDRQLYVLHEMKCLGATIKHDGKSLSDDDTNLLNAEDARDVCIATRQLYGVDVLRDLFKEQLPASDKMWKAVKDAPDGAPAVARLYRSHNNRNFARGIP